MESGFRIQVSGLTVQGAGFRVQTSVAIESKARKSLGFMGGPAISLARVRPSTSRSSTRP